MLYEKENSKRYNCPQSLCKFKTEAPNNRCVRITLFSLQEKLEKY